MVNLSPEYLTDESGLSGEATSISFPESVEELCRMIADAKSAGESVTIQGANTGLNGGAVPYGGRIINLNRMNKIIGIEEADHGYFLHVKAGLRLQDLHRFLSSKKLDTKGWDEKSLGVYSKFKKDKKHFWPVDPTETSATIGGILSTDAKGVNQTGYGETGDYINVLLIVDGAGQAFSAQKGESIAEKFHSMGLKLEQVSTLLGSIGSTNESDLLDLFLGSEGIFGIIAQAAIKVVPVPKIKWGIGFSFGIKNRLFSFAEEVKAIAAGFKDTRIVAIEYLDQETLTRIKQFSSGKPGIHRLFGDSKVRQEKLLIEIHGEQEDNVMKLAAELHDAALKHQCLEDDGWVLAGDSELQTMRDLRHAAIESISHTIRAFREKDKRAIPFIMDWCPPEGTLLESLEMINTSTEGFKKAIFGHLLNNHLYLCFLPENSHEADRVNMKINELLTMYPDQIKINFKAIEIGKTKKQMFDQYGAREAKKAIIKLQEIFNSGKLINHGNVLV